MERPEKLAPNLSKNDSAPTTLMAALPSRQGAQVPVTHDAETTCHSGTQTASDLGAQGTEIPAVQIPVDHGTQTDANSGAQAAAQTTVDTVKGKGAGNPVKKVQNDRPYDLENQFILRLPPEQAANVRKLIRSGSAAMKDKLKIDLHPDRRHAVVQVEDVSLTAKMVDLPCVVESLKTCDRTTFYKSADISQMLVCTVDDGGRRPPEEAGASGGGEEIKENEAVKKKQYTWKHGITPPLRNVRKRRFRKVQKKQNDPKETEEVNLTEYIESPDVEKEVKRLLDSDAEALSARWEVVTEGETCEIECQGDVPRFYFSSVMTGKKKDLFLSARDVPRKVVAASSVDSDDKEKKGEKVESEECKSYEEGDKGEDKNKKEEEESKNKDENDSEEELKRELEAKFTTFDKYETKEERNPIVMELQKQICNMEKMLKQTQGRIKRQVNLINMVEHSALRTHLEYVLEQLILQEKERKEQLDSLQKHLKDVVEK